MKIRAVLIFCLFLIGLVLTACAPQASPAPTEAAVATVVNEEPGVTQAPTEAETPAVLPPSGACLDCHTDKDRLIETAKVEEKVESESSGVG